MQRRGEEASRVLSFSLSTVRVSQKSASCRFEPNPAFKEHKLHVHFSQLLPFNKRNRCCRGKSLFWGAKHVSLQEKIENQKRTKENSERPRWNTLPGQRKHASDKPFRCLQCPPDFQLVSKETCCVPESIHQIRRERKTMWGEGEKKAPALHKDVSTCYRRGVSCFRASGAAPLGTLLQKQPFTSLDLGLRRESMRSGQKCTDAAHHSRAAHSLA